MLFRSRFDCIYEAKGKGGEDLEHLNDTFEVPLGYYGCFGNLLTKLRAYNYAQVNYRIYLYHDDFEDKNYNLCTKAETKKILRCLQKTVPFSYKFSKGVFRKNAYTTELADFDILELTLTGHFIQHLWISSLTRCFFEYPFNVAAKEACQLQSEVKEVDGLDVSNENWINLFLSISAQLGSTSLHGVVDRGRHPKARTYHEWKQKLESLYGHHSLIDNIRDHSFSRGAFSYVTIASKEEYEAGVASRASKYIAAYKDKLSWTK